MEVGEEEEEEEVLGREECRTCSSSWAATSFFSLSLRSSPIFIIPTRLLSLLKWNVHTQRISMVRQ